MKVAIVIGHNENTGARSVTGVDEWVWNRKVAQLLAVNLKRLGIESVIYLRDPDLVYTAAMKKLARQIKADRCTVGVDLHFNYYKRGHSANGFEFLYWWASRSSRKMAQCFAKEFGNIFDILPRKGRWFSGWVAGAKMLWLRSWNKRKADQRRGAEICYYTHCPFIICEPGFASNYDEWDKLEMNHKEVAEAYAMGVMRFKNLYL